MSDSSNPVRGLREKLAVASLPARVSDALEQLILSGQAKPGFRIIEEEISRELGVSRASLREAIITLEQAGYITRGGKKNGRVVRTITPADAIDQYGVYAILESEAAGMACMAADDATVERLEGLLADMQASASGEEYQLLNLEFHRAMTAPCSNRALREAYEASLKRMQWAWNLGIVTVGEAGNSRMEHAQVMAAYRARDAEGVRRHLRAHLEAGLSRLVEPS